MENINFNIVVRKEGEFFISKVLENNVSSFGKTEKECMQNTKEALELYYEDEEPILFIIQKPHLTNFQMKYAKSIQNKERIKTLGK